MLGRSRSLMAGFAVAPLLSLGFSSAAQAATTPLTGAEALQQFNLVVLGSVTSNSHVDGRAWIGGSVTGGDYVQHVNDTPASNYAGLTVMGSATNVHVNGLGSTIGGSFTNATVNSGSSYIGGAVSNSNLNGPAYVAGGSSGSNFNGGHLSTPSPLMQTNLDASGSTNFGSTLGALSSTLKNAAANSTVSLSGNKATFNAVANAKGVAVFNLDNASSASVFSAGEFSFAANGASTIIINSSVSSAVIGANFLGGQAQSLGKSIVWNFYNASSLTINNQFGGSILATHASLTNNQNIEGGVFVNSLTQNGELHLQPFSGNLAAVAPVPEPEQYLMMLAGLAIVVGVAALRRRRVPAPALMAA
ncbi:MAG TPA: collagen-binding domain-containing protein [Herbaspirillum sp.]|uniref:choice-of-anchor A family protein n=1 Tax=Herbaspirillum sp. TaxID=1890675 RepID=UPI002D488724|nr:collagen-binding domain-containing protein [Herbaspirillum sp.]HZG21262.1 collagen-binding domain-containing protein [Herbaspirillum sp.]